MHDTNPNNNPVIGKILRNPRRIPLTRAKFIRIRKGIPRNQIKDCLRIIKESPTCLNPYLWESQYGQMWEWRATLPCNLAWCICFDYVNATIVIAFPVATSGYRLQTTVICHSEPTQRNSTKNRRALLSRFIKILRDSAKPTGAI